MVFRWVSEPASSRVRGLAEVVAIQRSQDLVTAGLVDSRVVVAVVAPDRVRVRQAERVALEVLVASWS